MGSHLYWTIEQNNNVGSWLSLISPMGDHPLCYPAWSMTGWDKLFVPGGFGSVDSDSPTSRLDGYLTHEERVKTQAEESCPWSEDAYWVRRMSGEEFVAIVHERRWNAVLDEIYCEPGKNNYKCSSELRAAAALVQSLLNDGEKIRVTCWESQ